MDEDRQQDGVAGLVRDRSEDSQEIAGDGPSLAKLKAGQRAYSDRRTAATAASGALRDQSRGPTQAGSNLWDRGTTQPGRPDQPSDDYS